MDPLTAALQLANTIATIVETTIAALPPDKRADYATLQLEQMHRWRDFLDRFHAHA